MPVPSSPNAQLKVIPTEIVNHLPYSHSTMMLV
jgi:hypothetical protein